uniref:Uncharacterized protein n=1 Tax=Arion vulgaris TaxID=1028688 RepID=A0A0B7ADM7_9EUPU
MTHRMNLPADSYLYPNIVSSHEYYYLKQCQQENMSTIIKKRRWRWVKHVICMETNFCPEICPEIDT